MVGNHNNLTNLEGNTELWESFKEDELLNLRWSSLGYHFQWTPRIYTEEHKSPFPTDLGGIV